MVLLRPLNWLSQLLKSWKQKKENSLEAFGKTLKAHGCRQIMVKYWTQDLIIRVEELCTFCGKFVLSAGLTWNCFSELPSGFWANTDVIINIWGE